MKILCEDESLDWKMRMYDHQYSTRPKWYFISVAINSMNAYVPSTTGGTAMVCSSRHETDHQVRCSVRILTQACVRITKKLKINLLSKIGESVEPV